MKGIILAGGNGTRLYPLTKAVVKQLLPIYDKPMIYYPLSVLMLAGIKDILIISTPSDIYKFKELFSNGTQLGLKIHYKEQLKPNGVAEAFILGRDFIANDDVCLILGDNIFYGGGLIELLQNSVKIVKKEKKSIIFGYYVNDPQRYGVVNFDKNGNILNLVEKPKKTQSNYAVVGLYFYTNDVIDIALKIKPSKRGELEITSINQIYLKNGKLKIKLMGRGYAWLDTGTYESLFEASNFIEVIEKRQGLKIACIEEIAYNMNYITKKELLQLAKPLSKNRYGKYLINIATKP